MENEEPQSPNVKNAVSFFNNLAKTTSVKSNDSKPKIKTKPKVIYSKQIDEVKRIVQKNCDILENNKKDLVNSATNKDAKTSSVKKDNLFFNNKNNKVIDDDGKSIHNNENNCNIIIANNNKNNSDKNVENIKNHIEESSNKENNLNVKIVDSKLCEKTDNKFMNIPNNLKNTYPQELNKQFTEKISNLNNSLRNAKCYSSTIVATNKSSYKSNKKTKKVIAYCISESKPVVNVSKESAIVPSINVNFMKNTPKRPPRKKSER